MSNTDTYTMQAVFLEEMGELVQEVEADLLVLNSAPGDFALLDRLFRHLHTIKGGAGLAGMEDLSHYTHLVEEMLDKVRKGQLAISPHLVSLLLESIDCLKGFMAEAVGEAPLDRQRLEESKNRLIQVVHDQGPTMTSPPVVSPTPTVAVQSPVSARPLPAPTIVPSIQEPNTFLIHVHARPDFFPPPSELANMAQALTQLGTLLLISHEHSLPPPDKRRPETVYLWRSAHLVTQAGHDQVTAILADWSQQHQVEIHQMDLMPAAPENQASIDAAVDRQEGGTGRNDRPSDQTADRPTAMPPEPLSLPPVQPVPQPTPLRGKAEQSSVQKLSSIRVDTGKLDKLVNLVGELITIEARLDSFQNFMEERDTELAEGLLEIIDDSSRTVRELQDQAMTIRMVPIGGAFDPMQRLVHDYCNSTGKRARLAIVGHDTEVDKKVAEQISGPLKHLLRNALDHGIEPPAERTAKGKLPEGRITLSACHQYGLIVIEVADDGRGIDVERVIQSAREKGIIDHNRELSEREGLELIFAPSVSTATAITEISGRGVGMDAVKRDIEALRGTVGIDSLLDKGTTITVRIPMTLSIVDGLLVCVGENHYIIPLSSVEECVELPSNTLQERGSHFLDIRGELVPFLRLRDLFDVPGEPPPFEKVVIVSSGERCIGLVLDRLLGNHQTVIKSLSPLHRDVHCFLGATILGDGSVVLILDILHLIEFGQNREDRRRDQKKEDNA
ncbi:MAG: chemotaxis protein CheA [Magnetococcus sp. DMHC-8]